jgi:hypothetical protein
VSLVVVVLALALLMFVAYRGFSVIPKRGESSLRSAFC